MKDILLIYRGQVFDTEIKPRLEEFKDDNITLVTENKLTRNLISHLIKDYKQKINILTIDEFLNDNIITKFMKFDNILGNPPYQDSSSNDNNNNKLYNFFCKKSLSLLNNNGIINFITPTSVLKKSKRFSLIGVEGLKEVDFTTNNYFKEGVDICSWMVDKPYNGDVHVITNNKNYIIKKGYPIYNYDMVDSKFVKIYDSLKKVADHPSKRMFKQNLVPSSDTRTKPDIEYKYPLYKIDKDRTEKFVYYVKRLPYFLAKPKFIISRTKTFDESANIISKNDYTVSHMFIDYIDETDLSNIKSFIFSDYFKNHCEKWKVLNGNGFNDALIYLPPFDRTKKWDNTSVKNFIESFK